MHTDTRDEGGAWQVEVAPISAQFEAGFSAGLLRTRVRSAPAEALRHLRVRTHRTLDFQGFEEGFCRLDRLS